MPSDLSLISQGDWWCIVDYDIHGYPYILLREGQKGNRSGSDKAVSVLDNHEALSLWTKFNQVQLGTAPSLEILRKMSEDK